MFSHKNAEKSFVHPAVQTIMSKMPDAVWYSSVIVIVCSLVILYVVAFAVKSPVTVFVKPEGKLVNGRMTALLPADQKAAFRTGQKAFLYIATNTDNKTTTVQGEVTALQVNEKGIGLITIRVKDDLINPSGSSANAIISAAAVVTGYKPLIDKIAE